MNPSNQIDTAHGEWEWLMVARDAIWSLAKRDSQVRSAFTSLGFAIMARCPHDRSTWEREHDHDTPTRHAFLDSNLVCRAFTYTRVAREPAEERRCPVCD